MNGNINIKFLDLHKQYDQISELYLQELKYFLLSGMYIGGEPNKLFENSFAKYLSVKNCVGVGNGYDALFLALKALGVSSGDEVIVPSNTYIATWLSVSNCGAKLVPVEPETLSYNIDPVLIEDKITSKTKAIIPVHLYGRPASLSSIISLAKKHGLYVIEDAAQAHGASYEGSKIGSHGDIVAWSFYPGKNLGAFGDAGAITTNNDELAEKIRVLSNYGSKKKYLNELRGFNSRLDPIQSIALKLKLNYLDFNNNKRKEIAKRYCSEIVNKNILPNFSQDSVWHQFIIRLKNRDELMRRLSENGIETLIHYPVPPYRQKAFSGLFSDENEFTTTDLISNEILSLPIDPFLSISDQYYIIEMINKFAIIQ
jgi:dTDP-4-amino-4,6-dideoxygalactose transaminase